MINSPKFSNPPVDEVAIGFGFHPNASLDVLDFAGLWNEYIKIGFDKKQIHPPVPTRGSRIINSFNFQLKTAPDLPRFWFIKDSGEYILQVQRDKFVMNWRKAEEPTGEYISFDKIQENFWRYSEIFQKWFENFTEEKLKITNLELTYYNTIPIRDGLNSDTVSCIFNDFVWSPKKILPNNLKQMFFETVLPLDDMNAEMFVLGHTGQRIDVEEDVYRLELAVVGKKEGDFNKELTTPWYNEAHDKIVNGFVELTNSKMHDIWGYSK